jgi:hypothetical protein
MAKSRDDSDDLKDRKKLTFEQAEGAEPLPAQLQLREVSQKLRAVLWDHIHKRLEASKEYAEYSGAYLDEPWSTILKDEHVYRRHRMADDFVNDAKKLIQQTRTIFEKGDYLEIFGWLEFVLKHPRCPSNFVKNLEGILRYCQAAYRVVDNTVICPIGSEAEQAVIERAFADLASTQLNGARQHLRNAVARLTGGAYADSVRESIHAVEAVCVTLDPTADVLSKALAKLEQKISIHPAMKKGFTSLYAYTSDEGGIRHALLEDAAEVDETDALFMLGACASFVTYILNKARSNGLLK